MVPPSRAQLTGDPLRSAILTAVVEIVAREGFEGATIRRIATQAGCSAGAVQKRFATRSDLLRAGFERVVATSLDRILESTAGESTLIERQRAAVLETLPLDPARRDETLVGMSYILRAAVDDGVADLPRHLDQAVHDGLAGDLAQEQALGRLPPETDVDATADALLALADGIALRMLYTPPAEHPALLQALDVGLRALLT